MMNDDVNDSAGLVRWLDRLIHPRVLADASTEGLRRARILAGVSLCVALMASLSAFLFRHHPLSHPVWITPGVAWACGVGGLVALRGWGRVQIASLFMTFGFALLTIPVLFPLGGVSSRSVYWLALAPLLTMFLIGTRWAFVNLILLIGQLILLYTLPSMGVTVPAATIVPPRLLLLITSMFSVTLFCIGWAFESARRHANEALFASTQAQKDLEVARDAAELANQSKAQFISAMSHELRTPLNTILGYAELLLEEADFAAELEPHRQDLEHINASGIHLLRLVDDVLTLSSLDRGAERVVLEDVDVDALFARLVSRYEPAATDGGNTFLTDCHADTVHTDAKMLEVCLGHLLDNACRFTHEGEVVLSAHVRGGGIEFAVSDTGLGIDEAEHENIFDRFQKIESYGHVHEGSGLGLTITRALTERLGGSLTLESEPGAGSTFRLFFPSV